jgi:hypothetical protein
MKTLLAASLLCNLVAASVATTHWIHHLNAVPAASAKSYYDRRNSLFDQLQQSSRGEIVFAGDSTTAQCEWRELLSVPAVNRGIDSDTTGGLLKRIHGITALQPTKLFLLIGTNDLHEGLSLDVIVRNYRDILFAVRAESPGTTVYVQSILPHHLLAANTVRSLNAALLELAKEQGATYIDINSALSGTNGRLRPEYTNDGVHLMGSGYARWRAVLIATGAING